MTYLLDVNALVALGIVNHEFHGRVASWVGSSRSQNLASCSITELGFLRVASQAPAYGFAVAQARTLLERLKRAASSRFVFLPDAHDISHLPSWVRTPKQITDGHLSQLAKANGAIFATLGEKIPGSYLIPR
jgi:predicted nucleic acid-binding protein